MKKPLIEVSAVTKLFIMGSTELSALAGVSLQVSQGEFVAIAGASGSGKTTLLNLIGCLDLPTTGQIHIEGEDIARLSKDAIADLRAQKIGFVFQTFNLLPVLTALENVEYPLELLGVSRAERRHRSEEALARVGLHKHLHHRPAELSGGQRQRVAIARALVKKPLLILADEPTANLDSKTALDILDLMRGLNRETGMTLVFTSHDPVLHSMADRVVHMGDGRILDRDSRREVVKCV
jgi:putative ABC transport system ATP-binding protein